MMNCLYQHDRFFFLLLLRVFPSFQCHHPTVKDSRALPNIFLKKMEPDFCLPASFLPTSIFVSFFSRETCQSAFSSRPFPSAAPSSPLNMTRWDWTHTTLLHLWVFFWGGEGRKGERRESCGNSCQIWLARCLSADLHSSGTLGKCGPQADMFVIP